MWSRAEVQSPSMGMSARATAAGIRVITAEIAGIVRILVSRETNGKFPK